MIVRSEEKERSASEIAVYALLIVSALFSVMQIARQPFSVPTNFTHTTAVTQGVAIAPQA